MIEIISILGTDSISNGPVTINSNFNNIANEINDIEDNFGINIATSNMDLTGGSGGQIKALNILTDALQLPHSGTPNITLTGSTGAITGLTLVLGTSITTPLITTNNVVANSSGSSVFNGTVAINSLFTMTEGYSRGTAINLGTVTTHTVLNSDNILFFNSTSHLTLTADPGIVDGNIVTLVYIGTTGSVTLGTTPILGSPTVTFANASYKSAVTLCWSASNSKWFIISNSNCTIS